MTGENSIECAEAACVPVVWRLYDSSRTSSNALAGTKQADERSQEGDSDHDLLLLQRAVLPALDNVRLAAPVQKPSPCRTIARARAREIRQECDGSRGSHKR